MLTKKVLAGIAVVAVIALVAVFAFSGSDGPDARYNYDIELTDTFVNDNGFIERPTDGMQWALLTYTVTNDGYYSDVSTNPMTWEWDLSVNGITYTYTMDTYSHPGYVLSEVEKGETGSQTLVYSIPSSVILSDITVSQEYTIGSPDLVRDDTVKVEKVTKSPQSYRYDYTIEFVSDSQVGQYVDADKGMRFLKVTYRVANDSVAGGVSLGSSDFDWKARVGGLLYDQSSYYSTLVTGYSEATVTQGATGSSACVIQVPTGSDIDDIEVMFEYEPYNEPLAVHDDSLL